MTALTSKEISRLRARLDAREAELRQALHADLVNADNQAESEASGGVLDIAEQSVAEIQADDRFLRMEKEVAELADVTAAQARILNGSYGICIDCDEDIGTQRLDAYPTAKRCIQCQTQYEKRRHGVS